MARKRLGHWEADLLHPQKSSAATLLAKLDGKHPDPDSFSNDDLQALVLRLHNTPRKCLGFKTPNEIFKPIPNVMRFKRESTFPPTRE